MRRVGSLFAGYGGLDLAVEQVLDAELAWVSEIEDAPARILAHHWPDVPNLGDITQIDWSAVEPVDVLTGGFPCQDVSAAGKRAGLRAGTRTGLWSRMAEAIDVLRPSLVVAENVRGLLSAHADGAMEPCPWCVGDGSGGSGLRALGAVLGDLADLGYDAQWCGLRAADVGAPHGRFRVFVVAWPAADADRAASGERRLTAPGQTESWGSRADVGGRGRTPVADADRDGLESIGRVGSVGRDADGRDGTGEAAAHTDSDTLRQQPVGIVGRGGEAEPGRSRTEAAPDAEHGGRGRRTREPVRSEIGRTTPARDRGSDIAWGPYGPAIHRWERALGRVAPSPTEPGRNGQPRLSPRFVEWMQGLPDGWVTGVPDITRNDQLRALGNGVVPQQASEAIRRLLPALEEVAA